MSVTRSLAHALFLLSAATTSLAAQQGTVSGRVRTAAGEALPGATVSATGTTRGTLVRSDGSYQISLPPGRYELRARLLGYAAAAESVTVVAGGSVTRNFLLDRAATALDAVAVVGTRSGERTVMDAPVPIDVFSSADIQATGRVETAQMIQSVAPSFNFPRTSIGDGTDHIRPATLRGLSPDQTLVLVNGKRRHVSALVNLNGFVGRGSQAVDLNAIPGSMIDHIEVLRDGAAAQYGSDAIAGVLNIVLKKTAAPAVSLHAGQNVTTYNRDATLDVAHQGQLESRRARDGKVLTAAANHGWSFGENGFVQLGVEVRDRQGTNRTLPDVRQQYFTGDPRNANTPVINHWQGDSYNHDTGGFLNGGTTFANGIGFYTFGGLSKRRGASAGFWRRPLDDRTVRSIHPDGFLPFIKSDIWNGSLAAGFEGDFRGWTWDLGTNYGQNTFGFTIDNSNNVSFGDASQTQFDAGQLAARQWTNTLDLTRALEWVRPLRLAAGAEFRSEAYRIREGEPQSYLDGGVRVLNANGQPTTRLAAVGSQVFPGFRPSDAGTNTRTNVGVYADAESDLTSMLLLGVAGRYENYSDFGGTSTGKVAARFAPVPRVALRGALSSGFRAPSLGQSHFSSTATNFIGGVPFDVRTFPVGTPEARVLGASDLEPERSVNSSIGVALEPVRNMALTVDFYRITIKDRIVLSENFTGAAVQQLFNEAGLAGVSGGRFFTNAIDTRSNGLDVVANYGMTVARDGVLKLTAGYNQNRVKVTAVDTTPTRLRSFQEQLFGRVERARIELGNPRDNIVLNGNLGMRGWTFNARAQRYGEVTTLGSAPTNVTGSLDQTYDARWISDASAGVTVRRRYTFTVGADNIFDVYPERNDNRGNPATNVGGTSNAGIFPYAGISPFGFNGRFVYGRVAATF